jgi:hypothetical protein
MKRSRWTTINSGNDEAPADISLTPFSFLDIHAGYRIVRLRTDGKDLFLDARFTGHYVGLTVSA